MMCILPIHCETVNVPYYPGRTIMNELEFAKGVVFRKEPSGGILFNIDTGALQVTEGVAFGICDMIDSGHNREAILEELKKRYPDQESLEKDLDDFVIEMRNKGVLV